VIGISGVAHSQKEPQRDDRDKTNHLVRIVQTMPDGVSEIGRSADPERGDLFIMP